ncbi:MAG: signal peptide peptidase SppA [Verrucomicrobia bacterium]|nr:signal peptide peptidase SppA [Verrucomicrobiota bacterium]MDI9381857.1 signal peptide peptidase SppA [Verrucomicrobiota bacterium]HNU99849.1 signal peptide peptidase SppA [Verrucomicrobiota bacterium]HOA60902.1 signal peptide peptidase SppA [Verrucomicrobiota bacterium]HOG86886.1 signal peptide peptidase SppA [Verrucomicrobiota bacterium]
MLLLVLLSIAVASVGRWAIGLLQLSGGSTRGTSIRLDEVVMDDQGGRDKVAVIDIEGIIFGGLLGGGSSGPVEMVREQLKRAESDHAVKAVLLRIDSPGGEVLASDEINRSLAEFQQRSGKPIVASMGSVAASGGYYVAAPCRWIVANPLTITGSIGVIMRGYNYRGLMNKVGVRPEVYKSGRFKDMLRGDKAEEDILPEEREMVQSLVDTTFRRFKEVVVEGRQSPYRLSEDGGRALVDNWEDYVDGRVFSGRQAYDWGFVDELGNFKTALDRAKTLAQIDRARIIRYEQPFELGNLFRLFVRTETPAIHVDLGIEFPPIQTGRLYFLFLP